MAPSLSSEGFLRVCAWCKKIKYKNEWIAPDQYIAARYVHKTTHGICPVCVQNIRFLMSKKVPNELCAVSAGNS